MEMLVAKVEHDGFPKGISPIPGCHFQVKHMKPWEGHLRSLIHAIKTAHGLIVLVPC